MQSSVHYHYSQLYLGVTSTTLTIGCTDSISIVIGLQEHPLIHHHRKHASDISDNFVNSLVAIPNGNLPFPHDYHPAIYLPPLAMLSHAQPLKRRRSPSPTAYDQQHDNAFTSPLDVLIKRRRKRQTSGYFDDHHNSHDDGDGNDGGPMQDQLEHKEHAGEEGTVGGGGGGSASITTTTSTPYVDKRRTRQWDRLNAGARPSLPAASGSGSGGHAYSQPHFEHTPPHASTFTRAHSFPALPNQNGNGHSHHSSSGGFPSSPPHAISQPLPQNQMSSSPIRHQVYGSSPFKSSAPTNLAPPFNGTEMSSGSATRVEGSAGRQEHEEMDEEMDPDELRRGWGEQYAQQNELLHSLVCHSHRISFLGIET